MDTFPTIHVSCNFDANDVWGLIYEVDDVPPCPPEILARVPAPVVYFQSYDAIYVGTDVDGTPMNYTAIAFCGDGETWQLEER